MLAELVAGTKQDRFDILQANIHIVQALHSFEESGVPWSSAAVQDVES